MLSPYHQAIADLPDAEIAYRAGIKETQLRKVFIDLGMPAFVSPVVRVAVLGCSDRRLVAQHQRIFEHVLGHPVQMTTLDKTVDHLGGAVGGILRHDVTTPLPNGPYDLVYADILLRFIEPAKQVDVIANAYDALAPGGWVVFVFQQTEIDRSKGSASPEGAYPIDFNALQLELSRRKISFMEVPLDVEATPPGADGPVRLDELALVLRRP